MKTKVQILAEMDILERKYNNLEVKDKYYREELTQVLHNYFPPHEQFNQVRNPLSWESIFFKIGELNSDANYAILLKQKELVEKELIELRDKDQITRKE